MSDVKLHRIPYRPTTHRTPRNPGPYRRGIALLTKPEPFKLDTVSETMSISPPISNFSPGKSINGDDDLMSELTKQMNVVTSPLQSHLGRVRRYPSSIVFYPG